LADASSPSSAGGATPRAERVSYRVGATIAKAWVTHATSRSLPCCSRGSGAGMNAQRFNRAWRAASARSGSGPRPSVVVSAGPSATANQPSERCSAAGPLGAYLRLRVQPSGSSPLTAAYERARRSANESFMCATIRAAGGGGQPWTLATDLIHTSTLSPSPARSGWSRRLAGSGSRLDRGSPAEATVVALT
jgi:hypothetical protein